MFSQVRLRLKKRRIFKTLKKFKSEFFEGSCFGIVGNNKELAKALLVVAYKIDAHEARDWVDLYNEESLQKAFTSALKLATDGHMQKANDLMAELASHKNVRIIFGEKMEDENE